MCMGIKGMITFVTCMRVGYRVEQLCCTPTEAFHMFNVRIGSAEDLGLLSIAYYDGSGLVYAYPAS